MLLRNMFREERTGRLGSSDRYIRRELSRTISPRGNFAQIRVLALDCLRLRYQVGRKRAG